VQERTIDALLVSRGQLDEVAGRVLAGLDGRDHVVEEGLQVAEAVGQVARVGDLVDAVVVCSSA